MTADRITIVGMRRLGVLLLLVVTGCLESAPAPLTPEPDAALPEGVVGRWRCVFAGEDETAVLAVTEPTPRRYRLHFEPKGDDPFTFEGHASQVGSATVLNVRDAKEPDEGWYFATATLHRPDLLELRHAEIEELDTDVPAQVARILREGQGFRQACACVPETSER
jgi:hypothetical protein